MNFQTQITAWYGLHKRSLPWRLTSDPYKIWLSEILLQQTRVDQALDYYNRFVEKYPAIADLAEAREEEVLKLWQGLGYYTRARNLHFTARTVVSKHGGKFPEAYEEIKKLKGIGEYTAAAIASIAFGQAYPVVDGNVIRVLSRFFGITDPVNGSEGLKKIKKLATKHLNTENPGEYNQAIMEFGALHCRPALPLCDSCPLQGSCEAFKKKLVGKLPIKIKNTPPSIRYFNYLVLSREGTEDDIFYMRKRTKNDIWKNMYDFPCIETKEHVDFAQLKDTDELINLLPKTALLINGEPIFIKHQLTHRTIHAYFWKIQFDDKFSNLSSEVIPVTEEDRKKLPLPKLIEKYFTVSKSCDHPKP